MTPAAESNATPAHESDFREIVLASKRPVVVDFWAPWCIWCKKLAPTYAEVAGLMKDEMAFVTVNVDEERGVAEKNGKRTMPTIK